MAATACDFEAIPRSITSGGSVRFFPRAIGFVNPIVSWEWTFGDFTFIYPPAHSDTYVKATTKNNTSYWPYFATDPTKSLTGSWTNNSWISQNTVVTNQRFHIDLGTAKIVTGIYYENAHSSGIATESGSKIFFVQGSNDASSFAELTYGVDTGWTDITASQASFDKHIVADQPDPKYITLTNSNAYRYYAIKIADNWGSANFVGLRRIVLMGIVPSSNTNPTPNHTYLTIASPSLYDVTLTVTDSNSNTATLTKTAFIREDTV